ncbi:MAG TPA: ABC transporter permease [Candidatus Dormibacteraeota bacterium]|nr:ABC transporter permease [Candidatus Dormibacteraeota bacterium]
MALPTASAVEAPVVELAVVVTTAGSRVWVRLRTHPSAMVGVSILALYVVATLLGPLVLRWDPIHQTLSDAFLAASSGHPLGTDDFGRDELVRLMFGARYTLALGFAAVAIGLAIGVPVGAVSGYFGGWIDLLSQRVTDVVLAFPNILLALALVAVLGVGLTNVIIAVAITSIPIFIRLTRASALSIRELPYVEAARALGVPSAAILVRHVIPNSLAPVIVQASLQLGAAILLAAALGFLGLGVQAPTPEWGSMLGLSRNYIFSDPNLATFPGLAIFGAVLAFNLVGDGLRDALDPRLR